jgi:anti-sigma B factor antagonist
MEMFGGEVQPPELRFDRVARGDGVACLSVVGEIEMTTGDRFGQTIAGVLAEPGVSGLLLDLGQLRFMDSNGISELVRAKRSAQERGISLRIVNARDATRHVLEMLGVYGLLVADR